MIDLTPGHHEGARSFATGNVSLQQKQKTADQADLIHQPKHKSADRKNLVYVKCGEFASKRDNFSISLANCQSIKNKTDLILDTLCTYRFSIVFLTETWINNNDSDLHMKNATPTGYSFLHRPRSNGQLGGGIGAIVHNDIKHVDASSEIRSFASFEHMAIHTTKSGLSVWYYLIYRPPPSAANGLSRAQFLQEFTEFLAIIMVRPGHMCILGDFNIHVDIPNDSENKHLTSILSSLDLVQHVHGPTHSRGHLPT